MKITVKISDRTLIATLSGELDHHTAKNIKDKLEYHIKNEDVINLIFDFSALSFMDSSGIGVVIGRYKLIHSLGGDVAIVNTSSAADRMLTLSGIKKLIPIYPTVKDALFNIKEGNQ